MGAQIKASTAYYADDIYGVYLTKENMHSLTSTISSGSTTGVSLAFDDINWNTANNYALRCLYLKDCAYANGGGIPSSGILIYNSTRLDIDSSSTNGTTGTLNMRYVGDVGDYKKGDTTADPDNEDNADKDKSLILNLGANGVLETGGVNVGNGKLSVKDGKDSNGNLQTLVNIKGLTTIDGDLTVGTKGNPTKVSINGSTTISGDLDVGDGKLSVKDGNVNITGVTTIDNNLTVKKSTTITDDLEVGNTITTNIISGPGSTPPKLQFVTYKTSTSNTPAVPGSGGETTTGRSQNVVDVTDKYTTSTEDPVKDIFPVVDGEQPVEPPETPDPPYKPIVNEPLNLGNMQLVDIPQILFKIITSLYDGKSWGDINAYSNTTWVSKNYELKIKPFKTYYTDRETALEYLCYHITGYIECFDPSIVNDSNIDPQGYIEENVYLNRLNIDTIVRTEITKDDNGIKHKDLSLRIYNGHIKWGEKDYFALPYICRDPSGNGVGESKYTKVTDGDDNIISWEITSSPAGYFENKHLINGRVNMSSINGPYLIDTCHTEGATIYRNVSSAWITTTYYEPSTQS